MIKVYKHYVTFREHKKSKLHKINQAQGISAQDLFFNAFKAANSASAQSESGYLDTEVEWEGNEYLRIKEETWYQQV